MRPGTRHLVLDDLRDDYVELVDQLVACTGRVTVRGQECRESTGVMLEMDPYSPLLPVGVGRKVKPALAAVEALQLIGGVQEPALLQRIGPNTMDFTDGGAFHGAYGPRLRPQLGEVVELFERDETTRQAVVTVWDPLHDLTRDPPRDVPCTIMMQFMIRDDLLELHTYMRSNDVWWGLAYDAFQFTQLQLSVAQCLGMRASRYYHHVGSLHLYERDLEAARELKFSLGSPPDLPLGLFSHDPRKRDTSWPTWLEAQQTARAVLGGTFGAGKADSWWSAQMAPYFDDEGQLV